MEFFFFVAAEEAASLELLISVNFRDDDYLLQ